MTSPKPKLRWFQFGLKTLLAVLAFCAILFLVAGFLAPVSLGYNVKATFSQMPNDDHQLEEWLKVQKGVVSNTVRISREGHTVFVGFITEGSAVSVAHHSPTCRKPVNQWVTKGSSPSGRMFRPRVQNSRP